MSFEVIHGDALIELPMLIVRGVRAALCLTDPPYGKSVPRTSNNFGAATRTSRKATGRGWDDKTPPREAFELMFRAARNQIIFGANYFPQFLRPSNCYVVWDKRGDLPDVPFADCELAWTSFDRTVRKYTLLNHGFISEVKEPRYHETQKPLELMRRIVRDFSEPGDLIIDPYAGAFTTGVACVIEGRDFIGIDIDADNCAIGEARMKRASGEWAEIPRLNRKPLMDSPLFDIAEATPTVGEANAKQP